MIVIATLIPLGILGAFRWLSWSVRRLAAMFYRPTLRGHTERMTVVTPVYQEDPDLFRLAIDSWLRNDVVEVICVVDVTDTRSRAIAESYSGTGRVRVLSTAVPGKRDALVKGWRVATTPLVALVDSDTIWDDEVAGWVTAPFADPSIGGVATRQNVYQPKGVWQNFADLYLDYRYFDEIAAQSAIGQAVSCLSGRTAVYRREILLDMEADFMSETFLGIPCMSGDDKRLTTLLLERGHRTVLQREAQVWSTFPDNFRQFIKQRTRWARNTWRSDLRAMSRRWLWTHKFLAFTTLDKAMSNFTLLVTPVFMTWALVSRHWEVAGILALWWLVSRGVKNLPHFSRRPINMLRLPLFIGLTMVMACIKIYALATVKQQKWLTRDVEVIDGQVQRTAPAASAPEANVSESNVSESNVPEPSAA
jgi:cellulose synthase/poly-beta-1,6-N-acetylglucosamine synthase-like glycosyltransferase